MKSKEKILLEILRSENGIKTCIFVTTVLDSIPMLILYVFAIVGLIMIDPYWLLKYGLAIVISAAIVISIKRHLTVLKAAFALYKSWESEIALRGAFKKELDDLLKELQERNAKQKEEP